jgi:hypothetical protein
MVQVGFRLLQARDAELDRTAEQLRPAAEQFKRGDQGCRLMQRTSSDGGTHVSVPSMAAHDPPMSH